MGFFSSNSNHFTSQVNFLIHTSKEERGGGTVDWLFMLCTLNVVRQVKLGEFSPHKMKIAF